MGSLDPNPGFFMSSGPKSDFIPARIGVREREQRVQDRIRTLPELIVYNSRVNAEHVFCVQTRKRTEQQQPGGSGFVRVTHLQLAQAVGKCSEWLVQNVGELRRPWRDESGASRKGPPIALLMESDVGILFHLFAFMTLGVPVSWRGHVIICPKLTDHRSCYCLPVSAQPQSPICSPKHQPVLS